MVRKAGCWLYCARQIPEFAVKFSDNFTKRSRLAEIAKSHTIINNNIVGL
jgi:uncharacterized Fe-S cluster-containing radical SAM superfamily protein